MVKKRTHKLFIKVKDESQLPYIDEYGREVKPGKWIEVEEEINLGSLVKPNKDIQEFILEPISEKRNTLFDKFFE